MISIVKINQDIDKIIKPGYRGKLHRLLFGSYCKNVKNYLLNNYKNLNCPNEATNLGVGPFYLL